MKPQHSIRNCLLAAGLLSAAGLTYGQTTDPNWRLVGISGQQGNADDLNPQGGFLYPDNTLFEVNLTSGALTKLFRTTWVPDSQAIGFNPADGLLYHTAGANAYRNDPLRAGHEQGGPDIPGIGYQDSYYMEKIDLATQAATAIFNADPCPNPDPTLPCFGLVAPIPAWAEPALRRDSTQVGDEFRLRGPNEYTAARGLAWSKAKQLFYLSDGEGIFKLTAGGDSTFLARPAFPSDSKTDEAKAIAFVTVTKLLVGHRNAGALMEIDPETGDVLGELALTYPTGGGEPLDGFGGVLGLAQHPTTGVLYAVRKTSDNFARELVTVNPATGATTLVGPMGMHISDIVFAGTRLVGISGQQGNADDLNPQGGFLYPDNTLFEVNLTSGALTKLFRTTWVPDSQAIGFNPADGLLYHTAGANAYRNDPLRAGHEQGGPDIPGIGYQDSYYMEKIDLATQAATAIFNADPCPNPDPTLPCFGLVAPIPAWAEPALRRDSTQVGDEFRLRGPNEYTAARGLAWSKAKQLFYLSDGEGIFKLTAGGDSTFLARPAFPSDSKTDEAKAIAFVTVTKLLVGHRNAGALMEIDPETGDVLGELALTYPTGGGEPLDGFGGVLGLAQHPTTGVLYAVRKTSDNFARELVTVNPATGATTLVGPMGMHISDIVFAGAATTSVTPTISVVRNVDGSLTITFTGTLVAADTVNGTYSPVAGAVSPHPVTPPAGAGAKFYRAAN